MYTLVLVSLMSVVVEMIKPNVHPGFGVADFRGYNIELVKAHPTGVDVSDVSAAG